MRLLPAVTVRTPTWTEDTLGHYSVSGEVAHRATVNIINPMWASILLMPSFLLSFLPGMDWMKQTLLSQRKQHTCSHFYQITVSWPQFLSLTDFPLLPTPFRAHLLAYLVTILQDTPFMQPSQYRLIESPWHPLTLGQKIELRFTFPHHPPPPSNNAAFTLSPFPSTTSSSNMWLSGCPPGYSLSYSC